MRWAEWAIHLGFMLPVYIVLGRINSEVRYLIGAVMGSNRLKQQPNEPDHRDPRQVEKDLNDQSVDRQGQGDNSGRE